MIKIYSPQNAIDEIMIQSLLHSANIKYFIQNDVFGSLKIGPIIELFNNKMIFVESEYEIEAKLIISNYLATTYNTEPTSNFSMRDKIRMVLEALLFSWFVPGKKWYISKQSERS